MIEVFENLQLPLSEEFQIENSLTGIFDNANGSDHDPLQESLFLLESLDHNVLMQNLQVGNLEQSNEQDDNLEQNNQQVGNLELTDQGLLSFQQFLDHMNQEQMPVDQNMQQVHLGHSNQQCQSRAKQSTRRQPGAKQSVD